MNENAGAGRRKPGTYGKNAKTKSPDVILGL